MFTIETDDGESNGDSTYRYTLSEESNKSGKLKN